jgi:hypothetical protein
MRVSLPATVWIFLLVAVSIAAAAVPNDLPIIHLAYEAPDAAIAKRLAETLYEPQTYRVMVEMAPETFKEALSFGKGRPDLFLLASAAQARRLYTTVKNIGLVAAYPGRTIVGVTLERYGDKVIDDTSGAQAGWARRVVSAGSSQFELNQTLLLFKAIGLRCVDQLPTSNDSLFCRRVAYGDQPDYLIDHRDGMEAFLNWGDPCDTNAKQVYQSRPSEFRLIPINQKVIEKMKVMTQLPYVPASVKLSECTGRLADSKNFITTGILLSDILQSSPSPDRGMVAFIARKTGKFLEASYSLEGVSSAVGLENSKIPLHPVSFGTYKDFGVLRP